MILGFILISNSLYSRSLIRFDERFLFFNNNTGKKLKDCAALCVMEITYMRRTTDFALLTGDASQD